MFSNTVFDFVPLSVLETFENDELRYFSLFWFKTNDSSFLNAQKIYLEYEFSPLF